MIEEYDKFGTKLDAPVQPTISGIGAANVDIANEPTSPSVLQDGKLEAEITYVQGFLQSSNFETGVSGWQINSNGDAEFNSAVIRGQLIAGSIDIPNTTSANSFHVDNMGNTWWGATTFGAAPASVSNAGAATFTSITINGYVVQTKGAFGGNGADGALSITSGTTTINLGGAAIVEKNYTSISITGTGALAFSNPHAGGTVVILKSTGAVTITSSASPAIDGRGMGAAGGGPGDAGTNANDILGEDDARGNLGVASTTDTGTNQGEQYTLRPFYIVTASRLYRKFVGISAGSGGGGGGSGTGGATGGAGGAGGIGMYIECAGAWNFTGSIDIRGVAGSNGTDSASAGGGGGGGGGAGGFLLALYNSLTISSGTVTTNAVGGGIGGDGTGVGNTGGQGGGGASFYNGQGGNGGAGGLTGGTAAGGGGSSSTTGYTGGTVASGGAAGTGSAAGGGGGAGMAGEYLITQNTVFT